MDGRGFDTLAKALGSGANRRRVLRGLLASSVGGAAVVSRTFEARAKGKPSNKGKRGKPCTLSSQCPTNQICYPGADGSYGCLLCTDDPGPGNPPGSFACKGVDAAHDNGDCCGPDQLCCTCDGGYGICWPSTSDGTPEGTPMRCEDYEETPGYPCSSR